MKTPLWTEQSINIRPPDYSKENYLATFNPQTQLTLEQIFWSKDVLKIKAKALKEQTKALKPIKALTMYHHNTPATLVPRECYLTEVIPFFKTLKEHLEGIQKDLTKEIKEIKEIFEELEAEVDQNAMNRKCDEIERKNLLIANDSLIADCLSKEVFYIAKNSELTVSRFTKMHDAHTVVQAHCLELKAELSKSNDKIQKDDHNELVKRFYNVEGRLNRGLGNHEGVGVAGYGGAQNRVGYANPGQARHIKCYNCNGIGGQDNVVDDDVDEQPIQDLALNTMFMENLSSVDPVYDEAGPFYDSNILSEVHDHGHYQDAACEHHEEHKMHDDVQPTYVVDSHADYTRDSDMIPCDQYVKDKALPVVQNNVSFVPNGAYMMIFNDMHEQPA
nr:hypothetical protein [Tanacetum cinerariifolium]